MVKVKTFLMIYTIVKVFENLQYKQIIPTSKYVYCIYRVNDISNIQSVGSSYNLIECKTNKQTKKWMTENIHKYITQIQHLSKCFFFFFFPSLVCKVKEYKVLHWK